MFTLKGLSHVFKEGRKRLINTDLKSRLKEEKLHHLDEVGGIPAAE